MSSPPKPTRDEQGQQVALTDVARFLRQFSHDLRNHLNAMELQSTYVGEIVEDAEIKAEVKKLREMLSQLGGNLQRVTAALAPPNAQIMSYRAADVIQDLQHRLEAEMPGESGSIEWNVELQDETVMIDPQLLQQALLELFKNAYEHDRGEGNLLVTAKSDAGHFALTLTEPKRQFSESTENWGGQPFHKVERGHYGLGLHRARVLLEKQQGQLQAHYDPAASSLVTRVTLPLARGDG